MTAVAHSPKFAKKVGVPQSVGKDFTAADKGKSFRPSGKPPSINKQKTNHGANAMPNASLNKYVGHKDGGMTKENDMKPVNSKSNPGLSKLPTEVRNKMGYMKSGGMAMKHEDIKMDKKTVKKAIGMHDKQMHGGKKTDLAALKKGGMADKHVMPGGKVMKNSDMGKMAKMAKGGCAKMAKGGGIEVRGKTRGKMC